QGTIVPDTAAGGLLSIYANTFINQGVLGCANGETLSIYGLTGDLNDCSLSGSGSRLTVIGTDYVINHGLTVGTGQTASLGGTWSNSAGSSIIAEGGTLSLSSDSAPVNVWHNQGTIVEDNGT